MTNVKKKSWKFNFLAVNTYSEETERWIHAETEEDARSKLKENFYSCDQLENIILMDVKNEEVE